MKNKIIIGVAAGVVMVGFGFYFTRGPRQTTSLDSLDGSKTVPLFPLSADAPAPTVPKTQTATNPEPTPLPAPKTYFVSIQGFSFSGPLSVKKGDTVVWINKDPAPHTVTGEGGLNSPVLNPQDSYSFTFDTVGTFNYYCTFHLNMRGTVIVSK